jgi:hypothetical protein
MGAKIVVPCYKMLKFEVCHQHSEWWFLMDFWWILEDLRDEISEHVVKLLQRGSMLRLGFVKNHPRAKMKFIYVYINLHKFNGLLL